MVSACLHLEAQRQDDKALPTEAYTCTSTSRQLGKEFGYHNKQRQQPEPVLCLGTCELLLFAGVMGQGGVWKWG